MRILFEERRHHQRIPFRMKVLFRIANRIFWSITEDVSNGGIFFQSCYPPELGTELIFHLGSLCNSGEFTFPGKVIHRRQKNQAKNKIRSTFNLAGAGIAFEDLPFNLKKQLACFCEKFSGCLLNPSGSSLAKSDKIESGNSEDLVKDYKCIDDRQEIVEIFDHLCKNLCEIDLSRVGDNIHYSTYFLEFLRNTNVPLIRIKIVNMEHFDGNSTKCRFFLQFCVGDLYYAFILIEKPEMLSNIWTFPVPSRLYYKQDRRLPRHDAEIRNSLTLEFQDSTNPDIIRVKNILNLNYTGLSFKNYPGEETFSKGTSFNDILINSFDFCCMRTKAIVKHSSIQSDHRGHIFQRVGLEFTNPAWRNIEQSKLIKKGEMDIIHDPSKILYQMRQVTREKVPVLAKNGNHILSADNQLNAIQTNERWTFFIKTSFDSKDKKVIFKDNLVSYHYILHGISHLFTAQSSYDGATLNIKLPKSIYKARRRRALRISCNGMEVSFSFLHPLFGKIFLFPVYDISHRGLSFRGDYLKCLLWKDISLRGCQIQIRGEDLSVGTVKVASNFHVITIDGESEKRCSVEFVDLPMKTRKLISSYVLKENNPHLRIVKSDMIDSLWDLFYKSKFIYTSKEDYIKKIMPEIMETWTKLLSGDNNFFRTIVFVEEGKEVGTASAVKAYENTWILQHLATTGHPLKQISKYVLLGLAHFLMENEEIQYMITYFQPENSFPGKIYSDFEASYPLQEQLNFEKFSFLTMDIDNQTNFKIIGEKLVNSLHNKIIVEQANYEDGIIIEKHFGKILEPLEIRARSLFKNSLRLPKINEVFKATGLVRERHCLVAKEEGQSISAFALLENTSPGVNLSGLLNTFSLFSIEDGGEIYRASRRILIGCVISLYQSWGVKTVICLTTDEDLSDYMAFGFEKKREYICFTSTRKVIKNFYNYVKERYGSLDLRTRKYP